MFIYAKAHYLFLFFFTTQKYDILVENDLINTKQNKNQQDHYQNEGKY